MRHVPLEVMVDIETLDTGPRSIVLSVGAALFDQQDGAAPYPTFYRKFEIDSQVVRNRTLSGSTLSWWMGQGTSVREEALCEHARWSVGTALMELGNYLVFASAVWANGPQFDCVVLESLFADFGVPTPWGYNQTRDMRTLREESGMPRDWQPEDPVVLYGPHHPVYDCLFQIEVVMEARRRLDLSAL